MKRIVIIGSPGAGKSTLASQLGELLDIEVIHLDRHFWKPGWQEKSRYERTELLKQFVRRERWIIEGTYLSSSEPRLNAADTIIFLDIPPLLCLQRVKYRHHKYKGQNRPDLPFGCSDNFNLVCVLKVLIFPWRGRRTLMQKLRDHQSKQIVELHSDKEIEEFLAAQPRSIISNVV